MMRRRLTLLRHGHAEVSAPGGDVDRALDNIGRAEVTSAAAALALFDFYAAHPQELALGFYLGGGGLAPRGLGQGLDPGLNAALMAALAPMRALGGQEAATEAFALAVGLLVMSETRRIRLFGLSARALMEAHLARLPTSPD